MNLTDRYRPTTLAEVVGQSYVTQQLQQFVAAPYCVAFLFEGETGTGKTSAAIALAHDLGCVVEEGGLGGFLEIPSGEQTADSVRTVLRSLQLRPMVGSGWKVLVVNECDRMAHAAENVWLDALEHLPPKSVVVFTTNRADKLAGRFLDRCERFEFQDQLHVVSGGLYELVNRIWERDGLDLPKPDPTKLPGVVDICRRVSFRRLVQELAAYIRTGQERKLREQATVVSAPVIEKPNWVDYGKQNWTAKAEITTHAMNTLVARVLNVLADGRALHRREIAKALGEPDTRLNSTFSRLQRCGKIANVGSGMYQMGATS